VCDVKTTILVTRGLVGILGLTQLVLGVLFWTGHAHSLVGLHMWTGYGFVAALWVLAFLCARAGAPVGLVATAVIWGFVVAGLGVMQTGLLVGPLHWVIQVLHLLVGVAAMGMAGALTVRTRGVLPAHREMAPGPVAPVPRHV
jgi:hypothetical protein